MFTLSDLEDFQKDYQQTNLVDINDIEIDSSKPITERLENYFVHIKNPYSFMCGEVPVVISFSDNKVALSEKIQEHFIRQKHQ